LSIARKHWGIENEKHFVLDTILFEDDARIREGNTLANMALMRSVALNYLKSYQIKFAKKKSLVQIRTGACTSSTRRDEVLASLL
jgi:predicted transposase YbfD/YdcC